MGGCTSSRASRSNVAQQPRRQERALVDAKGEPTSAGTYWHIQLQRADTNTLPTIARHSDLQAEVPRTRHWPC